MTYGSNDQPRTHRSPGHNGTPFRNSRPKSGSLLPPRNKNKKEESKIYFIALLPNAETGKEIIRLKQEFAEKYDSRRALRVLPHITMQVPFTANPALEKSLCSGLTDFAAAMLPFEIKLQGFGGVSFTKRKVLYINVEKNGEIMHLHEEMINFLRKNFGFSHMLARYGFNPHISLAFRDLSDTEFKMALDEYGKRPFEACFQVRNLYLLRHTGTSWEVLQKCRLGAIN